MQKSKQFSPIPALILIISLLVIGMFGLYYWRANHRTITNFDECAQAGYPIRESYPAQCSTPDSRVFTQTIKDQDESQTPVLDGKTSWSEVKSMIVSCQVKSLIELHSGELDLTLVDGSKVSTTDYNADEMYALIQNASQCDPQIIVGME